MYQNIAVILLCGGEGKRFGGVNKAYLPFCETNLFTHMLKKIQHMLDFSFHNDGKDIPISISSNYDLCGLPDHIDIISDCFGDKRGPLSGVLSGLKWLEKIPTQPEWLFTIPIDTPFLPQTLLTDLLQALKNSDHKNKQGVYVKNNDQFHPVIGLWHKNNLSNIESFLQAPPYKMMDFISSIDHDVVTYKSNGNVDPFMNINHISDLIKANDIQRNSEAEKTPKVFIVTGWKNSGKTTLCEKLISKLSTSGYRVGSIKHAHHKFVMDKEGTDSFRHTQAGTSRTFVYSDSRTALLSELKSDNHNPAIEDHLKYFQDMDIVIIEGFKDEIYPKIVCVDHSLRDEQPLYHKLSNIILVSAEYKTDVTGFNGKIIQRDDIDAIYKHLIHCLSL